MDKEAISILLGIAGILISILTARKVIKTKIENKNVLNFKNSNSNTVNGNNLGIKK